MMKNKIKNILINILFLILLFPIISCNDEEKTEERADYVVKLLRDSIITVCNGGRGLLVLHRGDNIENSININIKVITDERMNYKLSSETLTNSNRVGELLIYPDSLLPLGSYSLIFVCNYGSVSDTIKTNIKRIGVNSGNIEISTIKRFFDRLYLNKSSYDITGENDFYGYDIDGSDGNAKIKFINDKWEITFYAGYKSSPQLALRRRFAEASYSFAIHEIDGIKIEELPVKKFELYNKQ